MNEQKWKSSHITETRTHTTEPEQEIIIRIIIYTHICNCISNINRKKLVCGSSVFISTKKVWACRMSLSLDCV